MKKMTFIGGGHSNILAIRLLKQKLYKNDINYIPSEFDLISENNLSAYSGMVPGQICGYYSTIDSFIDLKKFSAIHNVNFIKKKVKKILPQQKKLIYEDGGEYIYDALSINVGSTTYNTDNIPGVNQYCIQTRPISELVYKLKHIESEIIKNKKPEIKRQYS